MTDYSISINQQYGQRDLIFRILEAIEDANIEMNSQTIEDFAWFDQLHAGGIRSTRELKKRVGINPGMKVLDIGCGIGGPARTLAADFDCKVLGIDITEEYVRAARMLTKLLHLSNNADFEIGDALNLRFSNESFDVVWNQSTFMNINDKTQMLNEIHRVLRKDGIFVFEAQMKGIKEESQFPVLWADSPDLSFMITSEEFRQLVRDIGFTERIWEDITIQYLNLGDEKRKPMHEISHPLHKIFSLVQSNWKQKRENTLMGLRDGTYTHVYAVYSIAA
ncbi:MAG: methyltransferase domain-containing protein [Anaerolineaceae bacterium]|nr:methyltransferase domain-containing protein [Anaerolineaceae bacterium]